MKTSSIKNLKTKIFVWFTIVEIITTITIIAVISILGFTYANNYKLTQYNTVRASDIDLLNNTMQSYYEANKKYPLPAWNKQYFDEYWVYTHSANWAYWVSWFITSEIFGKEFMLVTQKDPTTKYYYAYARTLDNKPSFQFATSLDQQWTFYGYVKWTYSDNNLAGIVREYNWPNFVINNNAKYLPYNPNELKLTGNVISYSWWVQVIKDSKVVDVGTELEQWFQVKADTWAIATINLSDGSELRLWSMARASILDFKNLKYKKDDNLLTQISLKLSLWEVWVKAPQLDQWSEFSLETDNAAASVRWTVFGMTNDGNWWGSISLIEWKLQIYSKDWIWELQNTFPSVINNTWSIRIDDILWWPIMEVPLWSVPVSLTYTWYEGSNYISTASSWTGLSNSSTSTVDQIMQPQARINSSYIPKIFSFERTVSTGALKISNNWANYYEIKYFTWWTTDSDSTRNINWIINSASLYTAVLQLSGLDWINALSFRICDNNTDLFMVNANEDKCSSWKTIWFDDKPVAVSEESLQKAEIHKQQAEWCPEWKEFSSITNQCEQSWLVAYAGYNKPWDIFMSITWDKVLPTHSDSVVSTWVYNLDNILNKVDAWNILRNTSWYGLMSRVPEYDNSIFKNTYITNNFLLNNTWWFLSFNTNFSYFTLPYDGVFNNWWIFLDKKTTVDLDNGTDPDYLNYDISPLQLNWPYTIEMSVRWAALKRTTGTGILFSIPNPISTWGYLYFGNMFGKSQLWSYPLTNNWVYSFKTGATMQLDNNSFYTVKIKYIHYWPNVMPNTSTGLLAYWPYPYLNSNLKISIQDNKWQDVIPHIVSIFDPDYKWFFTIDSWYNKSNFITPQKIFIGSDPSGQNQWNDIIDYVKIYKN